MELANSAYVWWYWGLGGLGGWVLFMALAIGAAVYIYFDSTNRNLKVPGWRLGALLPLLLFIPGLLFRFTNTQIPIDTRASEWFMLLGALGATISIAFGIGYAVSYWGLPPQQEPSKQQSVVSIGGPTYASPQERLEAPVSMRPRPRRELASAWLLDESTGRRYELYKGDTSIGRRKENDIVLLDTAVSRDHLLIREAGNVFTLHDRGSKGGTFVNGHRVRGPEILQHGDIIEIGETRLTFVLPNARR